MLLFSTAYIHRILYIWGITVFLKGPLVAARLCWDLISRLSYQKSNVLTTEQALPYFLNSQYSWQVNYHALLSYQLCWLQCRRQVTSLQSSHHIYDQSIKKYFTIVVLISVHPSDSILFTKKDLFTFVPWFILWPLLLFLVIEKFICLQNICKLFLKKYFHLKWQQQICYTFYFVNHWGKNMSLLLCKVIISKYIFINRAKI